MREHAKGAQLGEVAFLISASNPHGELCAPTQLCYYGTGEGGRCPSGLARQWWAGRSPSPEAYPS